ncbi:MAG: hypothetical protein HC908_07705 [Calothrix sp. SM1_7_51]|nr:hypothetical protein [Calothrix sp. SM1_7_51]
MTNNFTPQLTADGSFTFYSEEFGEAFHSNFGALQESLLKFVEPTQLAQKAKRGKLCILDVCYGLGYNTAAALQTIWKINPNCLVEIIALELNPKVPQAAINNNLFENFFLEHTNILTQLAFEYRVTAQYLTANLLIGDARNIILQVYQSGFKADAIFLDPFSPPKCPQLWTIEFIKKLSACLHVSGSLATYSCAAAVRTALLAAGLVLGSTPPVGRKTPGTVAVSSEASNTLPQSYNLCLAEIEHLQTRAAVPYRDPKLNDSPAVILQRRQQEQQDSDFEPTSHWQKRWRNQ